MNEDWNRIEEIFNEASDLAPQARAAFLEGKCRSVTERREVESLLSKGDGFMSDPAMAIEARALADQTTNMNPKFPVVDTRFGILAWAGGGGMGNVYRVKDRESGEIIAIKVLKDEFAENPLMIERLKREVNLSRRVTHRNVCRVHDFHRASDVYYISMEFVDGNSLRQALMISGAFTVKKGIEVVRQICEGLREAHRQEIIHRDLKPENIMIVGGTVKIMDFGIARHREGSHHTVGAIGTFAYMSPEQVDDKPLDPRSDIYSLGLILYEMLTGQVAFSGGSPLSAAVKRLNEVPPAPRTIDPTIPEDVDRLIMKCLERDPKARYQSVDELISALPVYGPNPTPTPEPAFKRKTSTWVDAPLIPPKIARAMLIAIQLGYMALYIGVLAKLEPALDVLEKHWNLSRGTAILLLLTALAGIATRIYLMTAVVWKHPDTGIQYRRLFPALLVLDALWAAAPLLVVDRTGTGLALAAAAGLAYLPFAQKTLVLNAFPQPLALALAASSR